MLKNKYILARVTSNRSFVRRSGRITAAQARGLLKFGPDFILPWRDVSLDFVQIFGRRAPVILEIGFGMGETTAYIATLMPEVNFLCCEVHAPGVGSLLNLIDAHKLSNIRIIMHDAVEAVSRMLHLCAMNNQSSLLNGVHIFFPDPWHKLRHHKRRLIQPPFVKQMIDLLMPGGYLHCATDWEPYAKQILDVFRSEPLLRNSDQAQLNGFCPRPSYRPLTKFELRGLRLGHKARDIIFFRRNFQRSH